MNSRSNPLSAVIRLALYLTVFPGVLALAACQKTADPASRPRRR